MVGAFEYIVVGSGAGGGVVASRLALAGHTVLVLEAGSDALIEDPEHPGGRNRLPEDYEVPCFHALSSENDEIKWDYFVRHYADETRQRRDPKYREDHDGKRVDGVLYPRAGTLGGCTAHNAMITVCPHNDDWDRLAALTGDPSWNAENMRQYFERMEDCRYRAPYRWVDKLLGWNPARHGFGGWLATEKAIPLEALGDKELLKCLKTAVLNALTRIGIPVRGWIAALQSQLDPNDWRQVRDNAVGISAVPLATRGHARNGTREFLREVERKHPDRLRIELNALATKVLFEDNRAVGVQYLKGRHLFRAHARPSAEPGELLSARASREVILCGGAFNTPQLLMLSGIGPPEELAKHEIPVRVALPGVGSNLQDRYEVGVVYQMKQDWEILKGARFDRDDPLFGRWKACREGVYTTNGAVMSIVKRSTGDKPLPDLLMFALMGKFMGYFPGYSKLFPEHLNYLTWTVLKAHTNNTAGTVRLRSADPRDVPLVNFHYFDEGNDASMQDLEAVVDAISFCRTLTKGMENLIAEEEVPGKHIVSRDEIRQFVKDNAWGHHASCTCPIGPAKEGGVLNGIFEVHGVRGLRVVDASVFPRIPGFFIAASIYMVAEKASDVISLAAK
jgi:choline dehydrogenase